jgi:putative Mg2+ transporter-C (MgtC) family protein
MEWLVALGYEPTRVPEFKVLGRLFVAMVFGAIVGIDREVTARPAGLRTHMLVALAAAAFTIITFELAEVFNGQAADGLKGDPIRIIEAVTAGVAFLAAGSIIQRRGSVEGVTTGAGLWLAGALGLAAGAGYYTLGAIATVLALIVLTILRFLTPGNDPPPGAKPGKKNGE